MDKLKPDFHLLRNGLISLAVSVVSSSIILFGANRIEDASLRVLEQNRNVSTILNQELENRIEGKRIVDTRNTQFLKLFDKGVWAIVDKLSWIEQLKGQADRLALPSLKYNLDARSGYEPVNSISTTGLTVYATPIFLDIGMIHEGDLVTLVSRLTRARLGFFSFDQCRIKRNKENADFEFDTPNIHANCTILWFEMEVQKGNDPNLAL